MPQAAPPTGRAPAIKSEPKKTLESPSVFIEPIIHSSASDKYATRNTYSSAYPNVYGLGFYDWLQHGAGASWKGSHELLNGSLRMSIDNLQPPAGLEMKISDMVGLSDNWKDVEVGYEAELRRATFEDGSLAKTVFLFHTFAGDTPPTHIEKTVLVSLVPALPPPGSRISGEWHGAYEYSSGRKRTLRFAFVMRIEQEGVTLSGAAMDYEASPPIRSVVYGLVLPTRVTFLKRAASVPWGISLLATEVTPTRLSGTWSFLSESGTWTANRAMGIEGGANELPVSAPSDCPLDGGMGPERSGPL